ncbi:pancreatic lipase-related protein 2 [Homalodisca vitripennis]|nr:pancreatic lipase-related protein 2 [Homalodisca vitripennis]XP_046669704.1 pancreatic lipase-related protein 2 [Homalodisca vitripennis]KAG8287450.1 hypothetical protein J6590_037708 [Homalodisca vitripennis]
MLNGTNAVLLQTILYLANTNTPNDTKWNYPSSEIESNTLYKVNSGEEGDERCYDGLGCYSINYPWTDVSRPVSNFPQSPEKVAPNYCLFTRKNPLQCQHLSYSIPSTIYKSYLIPTQRVYFISHGFLEGGDRPWIRRLTAELLRRYDANVVVVDWGSGSEPPYTQAVANIRLVGTITALLIKAMSDQVGVKPEFCHMIGHSLGAHLSGYVGYNLKTNFGLTLGRITGLDPAEPHFSKTDPIVRLDPSDAIFVDIIHSDTTPFIQGGLGMEEPIGHLDFYPNGGADQPGCNEGVMKYINEEKGSFFKGLRTFLGCDHVRSHEYFIESVNTQCNFLAVECESWEKFLAGDCFECESDKKNGTVCAHFGLTSVQSVHTSILQNWEKTDRSLVKLFTITGADWPYCRSLYRVTIEISNSTSSREHNGEIGEFDIQIQGTAGKTESILLYKEQYYKPGSSHRQVVAGPNVGSVTSAILRWTHHTTFNILSWRFKRAVLHVKFVRVDSLDHKQTLYLCPKDEVIVSGKPVRLQECSSVISS